MDIAELAVKISEGALYPNFGLTASVTKSYDSTPQILKQTDVSIRGQITVPIYQGGAEYSAIRQSKEAERQLADKEAELTKLLGERSLVAS